MKPDSALAVLAELEAPLSTVLACLSSHSSTIHSSWRALLKRYTPCHPYASLLSLLRAAPRRRVKTSQDWLAFKAKSEKQGEDLAQTGVPMECVAIALGLYLECCLPYLCSDRCATQEHLQVFVRLMSVYQDCLLTGYARQIALERQSLEDRTVLAERRSQEFSVQLAEAYEKERRRLAQDLHDQIGHDLIVLKLYTEVIALDLKKGDVSRLRAKLKESVTLIKHALKTVRHLTFDLGPAVWNEQGFVPAVRLYVRQFAKRTGIKVRLDAARMRARLPARSETALYKVLQGALANVVAHAGARNVKITLASGPESVAMKIEDDGRGFNVGRKLGVPRQSYGLRAMRERIELLGGAIHFVSRPARRGEETHGTTIEARLPVHDGEIR